MAKRAIAVYARTATDEQNGSRLHEQIDRVMAAIQPDDRREVRVYAEQGSGALGLRRRLDLDA